MTRATATVVKGLDLLANLSDLGGDPTGATDVSAILDAAETRYKHIIVGPGEYLIDADREWDHKKTTYEFRGGRFKGAPGRTQTGTIGVKAGPYDHIFTGELRRGSFIPDVPVPYDFAWRAVPIGDVPTPFWFGAKGDFDPSTGLGTDDAIAVSCAQHFGLVTYSPAANYKISNNLMDKRSGSYHYGDGGASRYFQRGTGPSGTGHLFCLSANNGGLGIKNAVIENLWGDNEALTNENLAAMGGAEASPAKVENCRIDVLAGKAGRHVATMQYRVEGSYIRVVAEEGATEPSSSRYIATIEGIAAESGEDMRGNKIDVVCRKGNVGGAQIYNGAENEINITVETVLGDSASGGGVLARLRGSGRGNKIVATAKTLNGAIAAVDSGQTDYTLDLYAKTVINTSGTTGGRPFILDGSDGDARIRIDDHQDTDSSGSITGARVEARIAMTTATTGAAVNVTGADVVVIPEIVGLNCSNGVVILNGVGSKSIGGFVTRGTGLKGVRLVATDCSCALTTVKGDGAEAIRVEATALRPYVVGNPLIGASPEITALFAAASTGVICNNPGDVGTTNKFQKLGNYSLWVDATGKVRINNGTPASDTSGTVVGTQA